MSRWEEARHNEEWPRKVYDLVDHLRYTEALDNEMKRGGCDASDLGARVKWLSNQLTELRMYRSTQDGSLPAMIGEFAKQLQSTKYYPHADAGSVLDFALRELIEYAALREHMQKAGVYVNYVTIFPDDEESKPDA